MNLIDLKKRFPYNWKLKDRTKELRRSMTEPEKKLWYWFFKEFQKIHGIRVLKQRPIHNFIVDFYISQLKLIIEIDWESHFEEQWPVYDKERTNILNSLWLKVIRYTNIEIMQNFDWVCQSILMEIFGKDFG
jgi:very-short-patch-repair endonuclease